eukprot:15218589-Alexandrium_andersonii.AAC.1
MPQRVVASPPLVAATNSETAQQLRSRAGPPCGFPRQPTTITRRTARHAHPKPAHVPDHTCFALSLIHI